MIEIADQMIYVLQCISLELAMQVAKWGNSLAVRLPKELVDKLGLKEGSNVELVAKGKESLEVTAKLSRGEALKALRKFRGWMPKDFKFDREEAHARGWRIEDAQTRRSRRAG